MKALPRGAETLSRHGDCLPTLVSGVGLSRPVLSFEAVGAMTLLPASPRRDWKRVRLSSPRPGRGPRLKSSLPATASPAVGGREGPQLGSSGHLPSCLVPGKGWGVAGVEASCLRSALVAEQAVCSWMWSRRRGCPLPSSSSSVVFGLCVSRFIFFLGFLDWRQSNFRILFLFDGEESRESERGGAGQTPPSVNPTCACSQGKPAGRGWSLGKNTWGWSPRLTPKSFVLGEVLRRVHLHMEGWFGWSWGPVLPLSVLL